MLIRKEVYQPALRYFESMPVDPLLSIFLSHKNLCILCLERMGDDDSMFLDRRDFWNIASLGS